MLLADTCADMKAGRSTGSRVVGVATGRHTAGQLRAAGADVTLTGLAELPDVLTAIFEPHT